MLKTLSPSPIRHQVIAVLLMIFDIIVIFGVYWLALYITFGCELKNISDHIFEIYYKSIAIFLLPCLAYYWLVRMYNSIWRLVGFNELYRFGFAVLISACVYCAMMHFLQSPLPLRYFFIGGWPQLTLLVPARFSFRLRVHF